MTRAEAARLNGKRGGRPRKDRGTAAPLVSLETAAQIRTETRAASPKPVETENPETPATVSDDPENPFGLTPRERVFVEMYCGPANFNASRAYQMAGYAPGHANACRLLGKERVSQAVAARVAKMVSQLEVMSGQEALVRITTIARADIRLLFPEGHPYRMLPDEVARSIKSITPTKYGARIELYDALRANELMAKAAGKFKEPPLHEQKLTLAELVAGSYDDESQEE